MEKDKPNLQDEEALFEEGKYREDKYKILKEYKDTMDIKEFIGKREEYLKSILHCHEIKITALEKQTKILEKQMKIISICFLVIGIAQLISLIMKHI